MKKPITLTLFVALLVSMTMAVFAQAAHAATAPDLTYSLIIDHGREAVAWALGALAAAAAWLVVRVGVSATWRSLLEEVGAHGRDVVQEVFQVYVEELKAARLDGKLTEDERRHAKALAMAKLKERLGWRKLLELGGGLVARVFAGSSWAKRVEEFLGGAIEASVADAKREGRAAGLKTSGTDVPTIVERLPLGPPPLPR
jgi:hypothetical protein